MKLTSRDIFIFAGILPLAVFAGWYYGDAKFKEGHATGYRKGYMAAKEQSQAERPRTRTWVRLYPVPDANVDPYIFALARDLLLEKFVLPEGATIPDDYAVYAEPGIGGGVLYKVKGYVAYWNDPERAFRLNWEATIDKSARRGFSDDSLSIGGIRAYHANPNVGPRVERGTKLLDFAERYQIQPIEMHLSD